jgi:hypothetical protein
MGRDAGACHTKLLLETEKDSVRHTILRLEVDFVAQVSGEIQMVKIIMISN